MARGAESLPTRWGVVVWESGQSTVEFAVVLVTFLSAGLVLAALWHGLAEGGLAGLLEGALSHAFSDGGVIGALADILSV